MNAHSQVLLALILGLACACDEGIDDHRVMQEVTSSDGEYVGTLSLTSSTGGVMASSSTWVTVRRHDAEFESKSANLLFEDWGQLKGL